MTRLAMAIDLASCVGCAACSIACKMENEVPLGVNRLWIRNTTLGTFPNLTVEHRPEQCLHCENPPCVPVCPTGCCFVTADGIVDIDSTLCIGCRRCEAVCPYGAPQFIPELNFLSKCNLCVDEMESGRKPYCVSACMMRVLDVGPIDQLRANTFPTKALGPNETPVRAVKNFADPELTNPSIVFVPHSKGKVES